MNKEAKPEDVNMEPVGFRITRIFTDYAQKVPKHCAKHLSFANLCLGRTSS